ncbi:MAG: macro domain-containing protein [Methanobrevibacter millerae]|uniref:Macro domain-containing protein n=1 Tax=Methanobrevibacter millerae TaxID=230361 RepID=A0A8T3VLW8_9EURY|nr:macro domain-containing protein [Methanobrevibacter millerae]
MKRKIQVKQIDITELDSDAIVNAANSQLKEGGGVCGAIFRKAGPEKLQESCDEIGGCETGSAAITPGFNLKAKYVIHAVGPVWHGGDANEAELLSGAYTKSLKLAKENDCHSIAFPLISSGIYGYPKKQAWKIAIQSCRDFLDDNPDWDIKIIFAVISDESRHLGESIMTEILK